MILISCFNAVLAQNQTNITIDFGNKLHEWDGFGVNYVGTRHSRDYELFQQDYGGFKHPLTVYSKDLNFKENGTNSYITLLPKSLETLSKYEIENSNA